MIIINFKNYVWDKKSLILAKKIEKYLPKAIVAVPLVDLRTIKEKTKLRTATQHLDPLPAGRNTGFSIPETIPVKGTLLNHSEHRLDLKTIKQTIKLCRKLKIRVVLCAASLKEAKKFLKLRPYAIAFEDPQLVSTKKSIIKYKASEVVKFAFMLKRTKIIPLCGAGIHSAEDYKEALRLGCKGILVASEVANSKNPDKFLKEVAKLG